MFFMKIEKENSRINNNNGKILIFAPSKHTANTFELYIFKIIYILLILFL